MCSKVVKECRLVMPCLSPDLLVDNMIHSPGACYWPFTYGHGDFGEILTIAIVIWSSRVLYCLLCCLALTE